MRFPAAYPFQLKGITSTEADLVLKCRRVLPLKCASLRPGVRAGGATGGRESKVAREGCWDERHCIISWTYMVLLEEVGVDEITRALGLIVQWQTSGSCVLTIKVRSGQQILFG